MGGNPFTDLHPEFFPLQSRDPFSGDCDMHGEPSRVATAWDTCRAETRSQGIATPAWRPGWPNGRMPTCRAETRSQGIATGAFPPRGGFPGRAPLAEPRPVLRGLRLLPLLPEVGNVLTACRAETRSQGIATLATVSRRPRMEPACRAETRSQGIATHAGGPGGQMGECPDLAEPRPVLRGLRPQAPARCVPPLALRPCRAETRSQGIAIPGAGAPRGP